LALDSWNDDTVTPASPTRVIAAIGMARYLGADDDARISLDLGDYHPGNHGGLEIEVEKDSAGIITHSQVRPGLMHRSAEKLFEARDYRQIMMLANRHDWLSAVSSELGVALAVEAATGITPPERATWSRMLLAEAGRMGASALLLGALGMDEALSLREAWTDWQEGATGGRVHPMINRIGGLEHALPDTTLTDISEWTTTVTSRVASWRESIDALPHLLGCAVLDHHTARTYACSGAVGQASGVDWDLRRDDPYLAYAELNVDWSAPVRSEGDARARYLSLIDSMLISADIIAACVERLRDLTDAPFSVPLPKTLRAPEGTVHVWTQNPLGVAGWLLVSDGDALPVRLKARTPSFAHLQAMQYALVGTPMESLSSAVASFFFVTGDADR